MTRRERIQAALHHKEADKVPVDCGSMRSTGIMGLAYNSLKQYLGIKEGKTKMFDMVQQLAIPEPWYLERFQIDSVDLARTFADNDDEWIRWNLPNGSEAYRPAWVDIRKIGEDWVCFNGEGIEVGRMSPNLVYFTQTNYPLMGKENVDYTNLKKYLSETIWGYVADPAWRLGSREDFPQLLQANLKKLQTETDYASMFAIGGNFFENGQYLYRTDEFLMNMLVEQENVEKLLDILLETHLETVDRVLSGIGDSIDVLMFGDDLGTQNTTMISRDLYKQLIYPRQKKLFQYVHDHSNAKVFFHSCGAISSIIGDLIDAGVDILNPVQIGASGMEPKKLKQEFGKDVVFWGGGVDTQHVLASGTPEQVREAVLLNCDIFMKDGGFVFNQVHNIVDGVPPENIVAMYDAVNSL
ncbi:uroporphyrinogen decarboxylase family protein [Sphaerochaeta halotolerans]|jgi:uroporphyrinogen decarboxylase|uniref:uroporphyrinogen decarboxylase family protein n=1 Tax=Sphaerochaeta halotolerans TaxID=2293840 RepID=UPI001369226C|nr:uroporphyrinogen decarboxylase family protein [Sphaerochaeta halotolerans]MXI85223.1 methyltransferase [Sphaerochaeta halotolerans]